MERRGTAHYFLEALVDLDLDIDYIFANLEPITSHSSKNWRAGIVKATCNPEVILCPHEIVAVHMAGGYALATGKSTRNGP